MNYSHNCKALLSASVTLVLMPLLTGCQDEDFGYTAQEIAYQSNFVKTYGKIPADKSWDLSSWAGWTEPKSGATRAAGSGTPTQGPLTKGTHYSISSTDNDNDFYQVPQTFLSWLDKHLVEGNDNRFLGSSFVLKLPANDFAIIPVYQGQSAIHSELEIKINDYEITKIWTKSDGIQAKRTSSSNWEQVRYWAGYDDLHNINQSKSVPGHEGKLWPDAKYHSSSTIGDYAVRSKPIIFHKDQISSTQDQEFMYLSLKNTAKSPVPQGQSGHWSDDGKEWIIDSYKTETRDGQDYIITKMWDEENTWTTIGDRLTSINPNGYMLALNVPLNQRPAASALAELLPGYKDLYDAGSVGAPQALIIGCEDANGASTDHDLNDIVFLIVGYPDIPQVIPTTQVIEKRYLCEDLGATDDFDFNDVVVDVKQTMEYELSYQPSGVSIDGFFNDTENPSATPSVEITSMVAKPETKVQTARISHVCGTLPIQVQVGDYLFPWIMDPTDKAATRSDLMKGGWKYNTSNSQWEVTTRQTPTRAAYPVEEEGWNPNEERIVWGWDHLSNNIRVYVQWPNKWGTPKSDNNPQHQQASGNELLSDHNWASSNPYVADAQHRGQVDFLDLVEGDRHVESVTFPRNGSVPYIIAADPDFPWMKERMDIMRKWLTDGRIDPDDPEYSHVAGPGSGAYYEILPDQNVDRAIIWSGKSGGERLVNGVEFARGTSEQLGLKEAIEQGYNTINVYTSGVTQGWVGLCYIDGEGNWKTLYATEDADSYKADENVTMGAETWYKASIRLTQHQMDQIKTNGFVLQSYTNALFLRALDLTKNNGYTVKLIDPAVDSEANNHSIMGVITAADHAREREASETGGRIPFAEAMFADAEDCVLTATPKLGYVFDYWSDDQDNTTAERTITKANAPASAITAHFHFQAPAASVNLDSKFYHKWSSYKPGAHISSPNQSGRNTNVGTDNSQFDDSRLEVSNRNAVYGGGRVSGDEYVDLSGSNVLVMNAPKGNNYRFVFNRQSDDASGTEFLTLNTSDRSNKYMTVHIDNDNINKTIIVDLAAIKADQGGYVHLNTIKNAAMSNHSVNWIKVDALTCDKDDAFATLANDWDAVRYGNNYSINDALSFYNWSSDDANAHIVGTDNRYSLQKEGDNGKTISAQNGICATILGNRWNQANIYADLSNSDAHYMVIDSKAYSGVPRLWFNNQSLTFLANDPAYSRIYKGNLGSACHYVINLDKIRSEKGKVHLNSITTDYQNSCVINNVWVLHTCTKATAWEAAMTAVKDKTFEVNFNSTTMSNGNTASVTIGSAANTLFGNPDNTTEYLDLSSAHWMEITLPSEAAQRKDIRLFFNNSNGNREIVDAASSYVFINGNVWYVNLDAINTAFGQVRLRSIKGPDASTNATIYSIMLDAYTAPVINRTLTLSCSDTDYDLYINGSKTTSATIAAGSEVKVKAVLKTGVDRSENLFRFMWEGVNGIEDSQNNQERSFAMPNQNTTLTMTALYELRPSIQIYVGNDGDDNNDANFRSSPGQWGLIEDAGFIGTVRLSWNGRTAVNTRIFVPLGAEVSATAEANTGFTFRNWRWTGNTKTSHTVTRNNDKGTQYAPHVTFTEEASTQVYYKGDGEMINHEFHSWDFNESFCSNLFQLLSPTKKKIVVVFTNTSTGTITFRTGWGDGTKALTNGQNLSINTNPFVEFELTNEEYETIKSNKLFVMSHGNYSSTDEIKIKQVFVKKK